MTNTSAVLTIAAISQLLLLGHSNAGSGGGVPLGEHADLIGGLPLPFGVSVFYMYQESNYDVTSLHATAGGYPVPFLGANAITGVHNEVHEVNAKFDWWAQPWLNFHAILGRVSGEADASLSPDIRQMLGMNGFKVDYDGVVYGGGMTLAAGYKHIFGSVTANYTWADVDLHGGSGLSLAAANGIETLVITPKVGWLFDKGAVWAGAFYQFTEHSQSGSINLPGFGTVNFNAGVEDAAPWNFIMGGEYKITDHWVLTGEVGLGNREQVLIGTTYRF